MVPRFVPIALVTEFGWADAADALAVAIDAAHVPFVLTEKDFSGNRRTTVHVEFLMNSPAHVPLAAAVAAVAVRAATTFTTANDSVAAVTLMATVNPPWLMTPISVWTATNAVTTLVGVAPTRTPPFVATCICGSRDRRPQRDCCEHCDHEPIQ
ncbi:hypothetical protein A2853_01625 [Candidatus Kaiserbacteria bacterium RIFCSPHIGHO2_01_FULL_55_17]|uniref:Uncharacterized protein n=1 Tax=Candidatus Kaiserbacteria bacterium RIFCSPHIGHO2_01_FULL_55_17 TaxID=1798484 RepID=A0A1F6D7Z2_9BACT|nr:MAG: hypothetical protein A2853_01625 [Candidatus Kaiserbacteria bacterium RIFCSPHIGHO2_01_FULL_55_17]